jgi:hypothetical protein
MVKSGTGIEKKTVSWPLIIHPSWCTGGCWFTLALAHTTSLAYKKWGEGLRDRLLLPSTLESLLSLQFHCKSSRSFITHYSNFSSHCCCCSHLLTCTLPFFLSFLKSPFLCVSLLLCVFFMHHACLASKKHSVKERGLHNIVKDLQFL